MLISAPCLRIVSFRLTSSFDEPPRKDRKSTRLNSSHGYISYAVFCLKKKNAHLAPITSFIVTDYATCVAPPAYLSHRLARRVLLLHGPFDDLDLAVSAVPELHPRRAP